MLNRHLHFFSPVIRSKASLFGYFLNVRNWFHRSFET
uniref:Uncharacterized protein n=1 Tax=Arundo donax TaxID=35708 RepID=A0A0A9MJW0_ARUDO